MNKSQLAREFRDKYGMEMPTKKLARIMYEEHPLLFRDLEDARMALRYIEGKKGIREKRKLIDANKKEYFMDTPRPYNPYSLPKSDEKEYVPYVIEGPQRIAALFDVHCPYHSIEALTAALEWLQEQNPTILLIGGDFFDFYGLSRFMKDPDKRSPAEEIRIGVELLKALVVALKPQKVVFKMGNHDERFEHFLWQKMGEMSGLQDLEELKEITLENILKKRIGGEFALDFVGDKRVIKAGNLNVAHGHEFPSGIASPVNVARGLYLRAKANAICGHFHKNSEHSETDINGHMTTTWSVGCLCELHPLYMPINSWNHGVALITLDEEGKVDVQNKRIRNGRIM
jgi:UDP-2,3-diacylglucosamine pyrophosphatase LpxH